MQKNFLVGCGVGFIALGLVFNEWLIASVFSPDGVLGTFSLRIRIMIFEVFSIGTGVSIIIRARQIAQCQAKKLVSIGAGWLCISTGILMNEWLIARIFHLYNASATILMRSLTVIHIAVGVLLIAFSEYISMKSILPRMVGWISRRYFLFCLACGYIILELFLYGYFIYIMPPGLRWSVNFVVSSSTSPSPSIKPYLWSNYQPNPDYHQVNELGWRYGGGPKGNRFRIFCSGGSTTWSDRASSPEKSYPAQLETYLRDLGYNVDVVNGGASFYTSAEELGALAFRGLDTEPDLIVIHTGANDIYPLMSPLPYRSDYTHWRTVEDGYDNLSRNDLFRAAWNVPSWTFRVWAINHFRPDAMMRAMLSKELTSAVDILLAENDFSHRHALGLERNLRNMIAIARANHARVVTLKFHQHSDRYHQFLLPFLEHKPEQYQHVIARANLAIKTVNNTIQNVSDEMSVPVIPYTNFEPSNENFWQDHCHLNDEGLHEKAVFIGDRLIESGLLENALFPKR